MFETHYTYAQLFDFTVKILYSIGMSRNHAEITAHSLVRAEFEGNESHGISRLPIYCKRINEGRIAAKPEIRMETRGSVLHVDGGNGLGQVVSHTALISAFSVARESGIAGVFIRGSNHFGTAAYYCQLACEADMVLIAMTNSPSGIAPWGGKKAFFGTNPIAFGFPMKDGPPIIADMSSSVVARGKIILADKLGESIPEGWALDKDGITTTDPAAALQGALLPFGGAKGYALALSIEMLTAVLTGAAFGPQVNNLYKDGEPPANVGHSFIVLNISKWMDMQAYFQRVDQFLQEIKSTPRVEGDHDIFYPGERRNAVYQKRMKEGVLIPPQVKEELLKLGKYCGAVL